MGQEEDIAWIKNSLQRICGRQGVEVIDDTDEHEGNWVRLTVFTSAVLESLKTTDGEILNKALTFPDTTDIFGDFVKIKLYSGSLLAYKQ